MIVPGTWDAKNGIADFTWSELADAWRALSAGDLEYTMNGHLLNGMGQWVGDERWQGFTVAKADKWLKEGFTVKEFEDVTSFAPHIERRRIRAHESEGDLMYDAFLTGSETPFITKNKIKTRPGLEIEAELSMHSGTPAKVIEQYLVWLNRVAYTCEARGSDVAIRLAHPSQGLFSNGKSSDVLTRITVKRPGEWLDQTSWSPILSPAGYRGFVFLAMILTGELAGKRVSSNLGYPRPTGRWACYLEDGILRVTTPQGASSFPEEEMTATIVELIKGYR